MGLAIGVDELSAQTGVCPRAAVHIETERASELDDVAAISLALAG
jgi:hypothetical protein